MVDKNKIITYSLLAHINNNTKGINDLNDIFLPIVKRAIYYMTLNKITKGLLREIKQVVDIRYGLDIPFPILKKLVSRISTEYNDGEKKEFQFFADGSFILSNFVFAEYEDVVLKQEAEIDTLKNSYEQFLVANGVDGTKEASIFEFLDRNRLSLSGFFANKEIANLDTKYLIQANFINSVKHIPEIYEILKKVYLGSVISSYLEVDYGELKDKQVEFVLDTNFIVNLLNLSSEEANHTCSKILEICRRLGYRATILDFTIEEAKVLLNRIADEYDKVFLVKQIYPDSIYNACARLKMNKTDLHTLAHNLEKKLRSEFNVYIVPDTTSLRNKAYYSSVYENLKKRKNNPDGALHDAVAILYVQERRKKKVRSFYDANCWFVTYTRRDNDLLDRIEGELPEMIKPEDLVNILWLSNPNVKANEITEVGLTRLVSGTISNSLPSSRVLKEFDENLEKYAAGKIEPSECVFLANRIANKTITNLEHLNKTAKDSPEQFIQELNNEIHRAKKEDELAVAKTNELILDLKRGFEQKIQLREEELNAQHKVELAKLQEGIESKYTEKIEVYNLSVTDLSDKVQEIKEIAVTERTKREEMIKDLTITFEKLEFTKLKLEKKSVKFCRTALISLIIAYYVAVTIIVFNWGYDFLNDFIILIGFLLFPVPYLFMVLNARVWNPKKIWEKILSKRTIYIFEKAGFNHTHFIELGQKIDDLKKELVKPIS